MLDVNVENASTPRKLGEQKTEQEISYRDLAWVLGTYSDNAFAHLVSFPEIKMLIKLHTHLTYDSHNSLYMHAQNARRSYLLRRHPPP